MLGEEEKLQLLEIIGSGKTSALQPDEITSKETRVSRVYYQ